MTKALPALLVALLATLATDPAAARMYRCGSSFQDRPCENLEQQQLVKPGRTARPAAPASAAVDAAKPAARADQPAACTSLHEQRTAIDARIRGSSPTTVGMFRQQRRELEKSLSDAGCTL
jgi:hypothetical protein